jgi:hypothetical protein
MTIFTEKEIEEIESYPNSTIKKLWDEYNRLQSDPTSIFYSSLTEAIVEISKQLKSKTIDSDDPYIKSVIKLSEIGEKVFNTLSRGKQDLGITDKKTEKVKDEKISSIDRVLSSDLEKK